MYTVIQTKLIGRSILVLLKRSPQKDGMVGKDILLNQNFIMLYKNKVGMVLTMKLLRVN